MNRTTLRTAAIAVLSVIGVKALAQKVPALGFLKAWI